ncbi:MAG: hypothetical protein AAFQ41_05350 [Cyanobacteria bacterium J06623_7]
MISYLRFVSLIHRFKSIALGTVLFYSLCGCQAPLVTVEEISPQQVGKTVFLSGKVVRRAPFLDNAAYQLEDSTGHIWVVTAQNLPRLGQQINLKGKIQYQSLPFDTQELGDFYLVEIEQLSSLPE